MPGQMIMDAFEAQATGIDGSPQCLREDTRLV